MGIESECEPQQEKKMAKSNKTISGHKSSFEEKKLIINKLEQNGFKIRNLHWWCSLDIESSKPDTAEKTANIAQKPNNNNPIFHHKSKSTEKGNLHYQKAQA